MFRPATVDLVSTSRIEGNDEQKMADAKFVICHNCITKGRIVEAFSQMMPFGLVELRDAFGRVKPVVLELTRKAATAS